MRRLRVTNIIYSVTLVVLLLFLFFSFAQADSILNFPRLSFQQNTLTGIAIVNPSNQDATVTITAYGTDGKPLPGTSPPPLMVKANQQTSKLASDLFGSLAASTVGWFQASSSVDGLTGFFLFLDQSPTFFDGADLPASASRIVFNQVRVDSGYSTELNIINPGTTPATVTLSLFGSGSSPISRTMTLSSKGMVRADAAALFGVTSVSSGAYVLVSSDVDVAGFEFVKGSGDWLGLNAKSASEQLTHLYFPQMAMLGSWKTEVGLVNYSTSAAIVTVSAYKPDGTLYGSANLKNNPVTRSMDAGASLREDVETMFGFAGFGILDGWIKVESTAAAINGYVSYGEPAVGSVAAVSSASRGQTRTVFSHIATTGRYFTGLALLNSGSMVANVRVLAIRPDGQTLGSLDTVLRPGERTSKGINELIPAAANQGGGLIWVKSDQPVYAASVFGTNGTPSVLANIPAQSAPESYQPDLPLPALKLVPSLAVVQPGTTQVFQVQGGTGNLTWKINGIEGGNSSVGVISSAGTFRAPAIVPSPQSVTITAEAANQIAGASVDVLQKTTLVGGLGVVQSVAYLSSLQKLYAAELATITTSKPFSSSLFAQTQNSTIFEISPTTKTSIAAFSNENIPKFISFSASDGKEYLLAAGKTSGKVFRINPATRQSQEVVTGLNQPAALVIDPQSGDLLIAEADKISIVQKSALETGLLVTKGVPVEIPAKAATLFPATGSAGIAVDHCSGNIYASDSTGNRIIEYARSNGQTRIIVSAASPGQLLALYRSGVSCPDSFQLLVIEQGANRISLVLPKIGSISMWLPLAGVTDLTLIPKDNPLTGNDAVLLSQVTGTTGEVAAVATPELYKTRPINAPAIVAPPIVPKIDTVAGNGTPGFSGDNGLATSASLNAPLGVAVDSAGNFYIADTDNNRIRKVTPAGSISTVAGNGTAGFSGDGGQATLASLGSPSGVAVDSVGSLFISTGNRIRKVTAGIISTVAGGGTGGDGGQATMASLNSPSGVAVDNAGNLFIVDSGNFRIRKVTAGIISTVAGNGTPGFSGDGGAATSASLNFPFGLAVDSTGNIFIADSLNNRIRKVTPAGNISTVAGNGDTEFSGDGGSATAASLSFPYGVAVDSTGNLFIADSAHGRIRKVTPAGNISTVAGNGTPGFSGDGGPATAASFRFPWAVAVDSAGTLYIADSEDNRIRRVR